MRNDKLITGILILTMSVLLFSGCSSQANSEPTTSDPVAAKPAVADPVVAEPTWQTVATFTGDAIRNTEKFTITSDEWRITWDTTPLEQYGDMNFQIYIYGQDQEMVGVAANVIGKANDVSYMYQPGEFYLTINTAQSYNIVIEELK